MQSNPRCHVLSFLLSFLVCHGSRRFVAREKSVFDTLRVVSLGVILVCEVMLCFDGPAYSLGLFCRSLEAFFFVYSACWHT